MLQKPLEENMQCFKIDPDINAYYVHFISFIIFFSARQNEE